MPIRNAPPGSKCVRCPCNCLLICKSSSQRIACPKPDCKRIINLAPGSTPPVLSMPSGDIYWVGCAHCHDSFLKWRKILFKFLLARKRSFIQLLYRLKNISKYWEEFNTSNKSLARCPHCRKISSVGPGFRRRGIRYIIAALVYAIFLTWVAYTYIKREETEKRDYDYYVLFAAFLSALLLLVRGIRLCTIKISLIEEALVLKNNNEEPP